MIAVSLSASPVFVLYIMLGILFPTVVAVIVTILCSRLFWKCCDKNSDKQGVSAITEKVAIGRCWVGGGGLCMQGRNCHEASEALTSSSLVHVCIY